MSRMIYTHFKHTPMISGGVNNTNSAYWTRSVLCIRNLNVNWSPKHTFLTL